MRSIICRFKDEAEFNHHLSNGSAFSFLAEMDFTLGTEIVVNIVIASSRQRERFNMFVVERTALALDVGESTRSRSRLWQYRARVHDCDRIWMQAFGARLSMANVHSFAA